MTHGCDAMRPLLAIFVGGKSRRMGVPKGLLPVPGGSEPIVEALVHLSRQMGLEVALIGDAAPYRELAVGVARVGDDPPGGGPLAGLRAAAQHAIQTGHSHLVAVACDMPHLSAEALAQACYHPSDSHVLAPRRLADGPWEPMLARYDAACLVHLLDEATIRRARSFQALFQIIDVAPLPLSLPIERALQDWDAPEDIGS
jgi:molybdopterin-guanine dinucleotide biosynthesis protein A